MQKLAEVEEAKKLLNEAKDWSIWKWLTQKKYVRATADRGTAALDEAEKRAKASWNDDLKIAYAELLAMDSMDGQPGGKRQYEKARKAAEGIDSRIKAAAKRVKEADQDAYAARMDAEDTFAEAERRLSASMAREGSRKAIYAYDVRETAIRKAEAANRIK